SHPAPRGRNLHSRSPSEMGKIIVYEHVNFQVPLGWNDMVSSVKVIGQPWVAYKHIEYKGPFMVFEEGEYESLPKGTNDKISSLQLITDDLRNPQITLYQHVEYKGRSRIVTEASNLAGEKDNDIVSSHKVQRGVWLLFENSDEIGPRYLARAHEDVPNYKEIDFNDRLSFLRPLRPGRDS
ncbi:hypothetical protein HGM15179_021640, partial [Zosterops borbonicus]